MIDALSSVEYLQNGGILTGEANMKRLVLTLAIGLMACGCSTARTVGDRAPNTFAAAPYAHSVHSDVIQMDLARLLSSKSETIEAGLVGFEGDVRRRNEVIGALLLASDRNCDIYMENLRGAQATWRTGFSTASVFLGGAGPLFSDPDTPGILSALSGITSGVSGKLDEGLMAGLTADVILAGVRAARAPLRQAIIDNIETNTDYNDWPIGVAIADVMQYHGRCNVISGLSAAQRATEDAVSAAGGNGTLAAATNGGG